VTNYVRNASPDVVLIHLGTNDIFRRDAPADVAQELGGLIDTIRAAKPDVRILLSKLIPSEYFPADFTALNVSIDGVVSGRNNSSSYPRVIVVDQASGYQQEVDNYDGVHPAPTGEMKIATKWSEAILALRTP
jgi:lysophospholipase L1-like esterase